jgi:hypothetical protein
MPILLQTIVLTAEVATRFITNDSNNSSNFEIAGGTSGMKVSWQVTGIRKDPWANANRIQVEEDKPSYPYTFSSVSTF